MFVKLCFKLKLHEKDLFLMKVIVLVTWCTNFCPTDGTCPENGTVSCAAVEVQTSWSGNPWNTLLCQNYLMKQQRAVWACGASQALVSPVPGPSQMIAALCSAGSIVLLSEEGQCQAPGDYAPLQKQWVETDGKGYCTPAHLLSISLLLDGPSHLPVVTL